METIALSPVFGNMSTTTAYSLYLFIALHSKPYFPQLSDSYDLVINCTGFGARKLCGDTSIEPVRGQVIRVCTIYCE